MGGRGEGTPLLRLAAAVGILAMAWFVAPAADAAPGGRPAGPGTVTVDQGPVGPTGFCLPPVFGLSYTTHQDADTFSLTITASPTVCAPIDVSAAIYAMPTDGSAWPQRLAVRTPFVIRGPGVTTVTFHKGCLPAQFDVVTGATPPVISPVGEWHGPLLFPFSTESSLQFPGGDCGEVGGGCDSYTPKNVVVEPDVVPPGATVTVSGTGVPGTTIEISLQQPPGSPIPTGASVVVAESGQWSVPVTVPADLAPGRWQVVAGVDGCQTATTADITVTGDASGGSGGTTTTPGPDRTDATPSTEAAVAGISTTADATDAALPAAAVDGVSGTGGDARAAGLAFTGSSVRVPVLVGVGLVVAGTLLLLRRRRRS